MMIDELLTDKQKRELPVNETVLWCGRDHGKVWGPGVFAPMLFAIPWCTITFLSIWQALVPQWMGIDPHTKAKKTYDLLQLIGVSIGILPFVAIGICMLLAPLWCWLALRKRVWVVTDKAVYKFGFFSPRCWRRAEINDAVDRVDRVDGTSDFHFATETFTSRRGSRGTMLCSIKNVPQMEAMALDAAFRRLTEYSAAD